MIPYRCILKIAKFVVSPGRSRRRECRLRILAGSALHASSPGTGPTSCRYSGKFERVIVLSDVVDPASIDATLENGVLQIALSRRPEAQPRMIQIRHGSSGVKKLSDESSEN
ncbi:MAG: Hsp20 family protein [Fuerstiella sp.]